MIRTRIRTKDKNKSIKFKHYNMLYTDYSFIRDENIPSTPTAIYITNTIMMPINCAKTSCKNEKHI